MDNNYCLFSGTYGWGQTLGQGAYASFPSVFMAVLRGRDCRPILQKGETETQAELLTQNLQLKNPLGWDYNPALTPESMVFHINNPFNFVMIYNII